MRTCLNWNMPIGNRASFRKTVNGACSFSHFYLANSLARLQNYVEFCDLETKLTLAALAVEFSVIMSNYLLKLVPNKWKHFVSIRFVFKSLKLLVNSKKKKIANVSKEFKRNSKLLNGSHESLDSSYCIFNHFFKSNRNCDNFPSEPVDDVH